MSTYQQFVAEYGDDYDTETERRAGYELHEQTRREMSEIFFGVDHRQLSPLVIDLHGHHDHGGPRGAAHRGEPADSDCEVPS